MRTGSRQAVFQRGPRFFQAEDQILYEFVMDAGSRIGPRVATEKDKEDFPEAWERFVNDEPAESPLKPVVQPQDARTPEQIAQADVEQQARQSAREARRKGVAA